MQTVLIALSILLVAVVAFAASAPLLYVDPLPCVLGFAAVAGGLVALRTRLRLRTAALGSGLGLAAVGLVLAAPLLSFLEGGFDDGPFRGRPYAGSVAALVPGDSVAFRSGRLVVYNRERPAAPVLAYRAGGRVVWAHEMHVPAEFNDDGLNDLWTITEPTLDRGVLRDRLDFRAEWSQGNERGTAYLWKLGGVQRFYLSW